ncbi:hypothetical protein FNV43_RR08548 [Rhamnella rubrinervis]|uniref:RING-type E3 ubiquitin transferase n=1 Tax=Rhamnella rubrinervis TaxID=2594499 RepID=A0A8K0H8F1_9ROSA|nr:hypothetical protein FNV43_RR08548 [Rhamnella rubrinervis]
MRNPPTQTVVPPSPSSSSSAATATVFAVATQLIHTSPPLSSATSTETNCSQAHGAACRWRSHYSASRDFEANAALVLIILLCALICALALNASIRCFLRGSSGGGGDPVHHLPRSQTELVQLQHKTINGGAPLESVPTMVYSAGMKTKLAGVEAECVICLSEFVEERRSGFWVGVNMDSIRSAYRNGFRPTPRVPRVAEASDLRRRRRLCRRDLRP